MIQQVSDAELEIMKIIWTNSGTALFAMIMKELEVKGRTWQKKYSDYSFISFDRQGTMSTLLQFLKLNTKQLKLKAFSIKFMREM